MSGRPWTADEDETMRLNWPKFPAFLIAHVLHRGRAAIYQRAKKLGLQKAGDFETQPIARLWNGTQEEGSIASRFRAGQTPHNKGVRRPGWAPGRMGATQFKKGQMRGAAQHNYQPIGTQRVSNGVLERKVTDDPSLVPARRWQPVARIVWEEVNGSIPPGHAVVFRPGCATVVEELITLEAVELVTRAELMRRNSRHTRYPPELNQIIQLRAAMVRKINTRIKKKEQQA